MILRFCILNPVLVSNLTRMTPGPNIIEYMDGFAHGTFQQKFLLTRWLHCDPHAILSVSQYIFVVFVIILSPAPLRAPRMADVNVVKFFASFCDGYSARKRKE